jgi:hypothetical protein
MLLNERLAERHADSTQSIHLASPLVSSSPSLHVGSKARCSTWAVRSIDAESDRRAPHQPGSSAPFSPSLDSAKGRPVQSGCATMPNPHLWTIDTLSLDVSGFLLS